MNEKEILKNQRVINIVVSYANEHEVLEYAKRLSMQSISEDISLVIVINKIGIMPEEQFVSELKKIKIDTHIYNPNKNLGYLNGLIYGYNAYSKDNDILRWIVMSNTDINFPDNHFFEMFLKKEYDKDTWLVGPSVYSPETGSYENPQYDDRHTINSINKRIFVFSRPILAYYYLKMAKIKAKVIRKGKQKSKFSYSVHGCFFFVDKEFIKVIKNKEYGALMYTEEAYLAEFVRLNNKKCYYNSEIEVVHEGSTVTGKLEIKRKAGYFLESLEFLKREFYSS